MRIRTVRSLLPLPWLLASWLVLAVPVAGYAQSAAEQPAPPEPSEPATKQSPPPTERDNAAAGVAFDKTAAKTQIAAVLESLRVAMRDGDHDKIAAYLNTGRMLNEAAKAKQGNLGLNLFQRVTLSLRLRKEYSRNFSSIVGRWERVRLSAVKFAANGQEAVAQVRTWDNEGSSMRHQLWLVHSEDGWQVYDVESLAVGLRMSSMIPIALDAARGGAAAELKVAAEGLEAAATAIRNEDFEAAQRGLDGIAAVKLPAFMEAVRWQLVGLVALSEDDAQAAISAFNHSGSFRPERTVLDYLRAVAYNAGGLHKQAQKYAEKFLAEHGDDAEAYLELGDALAGLGRRDEAIAAYRKGLADTPDLVGNLIALGLALPADNKQELAVGFRRLRRAKQHFETIAVEFVHVGDAAALDVLVDAYERLAPEDPNVVYYRAMALALNERYDAAAKLLPPVFGKIRDAEERWYYVELFLDCCLSLDDALQGYTGAPTAEKQRAFTYLTDKLLSEEQFSALKPLLAEHGKKFPLDPWLNYYTGDVHYFQGEFAAADEAYAQAKPQRDDEALREDIRFSRVACWYQLGKGAAAYGKFPPADRTFEQLTSLSIEEADADLLLALVGRRQQDVGRTPELVRLTATAAWLKKDYAAVIKQLQSHRAQLAKHAEPDDLVGDEDLLVRSFVRLGKFDEALRIARQSTARDKDPYFEAVVHAARGDAEACAAALSACLKLGTYDTSEFLADEEIGPSLARDSFAAARNLVLRPAAKPADDPLKSLVFLLAKPLKLDTEVLAAAAKAAWKLPLALVNDMEAAAKETPQENVLVRVNDGSFGVLVKGIRLAVHSRPEPYVEDLDKAAAQIGELRLRSAYVAHRAWIAVDLVGKPDEISEPEAYQFAGRLLTELARDTDVLVVLARQTRQMAVYSETLAVALCGPHPLAALGDPVDPPVVAVADGDRAMQAAMAEARRRFDEFAAAFARRQPGNTFSVKVRFADGDKVEFMWINVTNLEAKRIHGTLNNTPVFVKNIKFGDKTSIPLQEIADWVYTDGTKVVGLFTAEVLDRER